MIASRTMSPFSNTLCLLISICTVLLLSFSVDSIASASQQRCADINALHEVKFTTHFKNTIQAYRFLPGNQLLASTQGIEFTKWSQTNAFYKTVFTEENGGQDQLTPLYGDSLKNIVKDFILLKKDDPNGGILFAQVDGTHKLQFNYDGKKVLDTPYPLKSEHVYDAEGNVMSTEHFDSIKLEDTSFEASRRQFQILPLKEENKFVFLVFSEGSLKLVSAEFSQQDDSEPKVSYTWSHLIVPRVKSFEIEGKTYDSVLHFDDDSQQILLVVTLDKAAQKAAFEKEHMGFSLDFKQMERVPFILTFDLNGKLLSVRNAVSNIFKGQKKAYVGGIDFRDEKLLLVGNDFPAQGLYFNHFSENAYFSLIDLSELTEDSTTTKALDFLFYGADAADGFVARDATFAPDSESTDLFFFGGELQRDAKNLFDIESRIVLSNGKASLQQLYVGQSGSNIVRRLSRYNSQHQDERVVADLYMDGPTSPPEHPNEPKLDPFRKTHAGFWQVDCSSPDATLATASFISFFSVIGVSMFVFITTVSAFSVVCVFQIREKRRLRAEKSEERRRLIN